MNKIYDETINFQLFAIDRFKEGKEYEKELKKAHELSKIAKSLIQEYGDQIVFDSWYKHLEKYIKTKREAWNYMIAFFDYDGYHLKIKDPYPFLGLLLVKSELSLDRDPANKDEKRMFNTFDSIYIELLINSGIITSDEYFDMNPYFDERLKAAYNSAKLTGK